MDGQELAFLLRERFRQEHAAAMREVVSNLLSGESNAMISAAAKAGRVRAVEDADKWLIEIIKGLNGDIG